MNWLQKINIFLAYISELIENDRADAAKENIQDIWVTVHGGDPDVQAVLSLLESVETPEKRQKYLKMRVENIPRESSFWPEWFPTDEQTATEYLRLLSETNEEEMEKAALFVLRRAGQLNNLNLMRIALQFHQPSTKPFHTWLSLMLPFHRLDPGAEKRLFAEPYVEGAMKIHGHGFDHSRSWIVCKQINAVIKDRLVALRYDRWALKMLAWLCISALKIKRPERRIRFLRMIEAEQLYDFLKSRRGEIHDETLAEMKRHKFDRRTSLKLLSKLDASLFFLDKMCELLKRVHAALDIEVRKSCKS
ncbi:hypothetical protein BDB00DRAFT_229484 [Zychaea mexicana]|uniref:uncharacterized protein n=1 Tax=Zychaea mexicana TaxID=64656 RepID=UPI0022FEBDA1|nr:uncharacterized protein BDB00DRAFT_229484 [Zychaea mexicana]KAI9499329.1 hypothetical protein BDB00DRAFT_229484 [Zychaea mexicana]